MWKIDRGSTTGTTTAEYSDVLDWITTELGEKTILLKNSGSPASLKYKMSGYAGENGIAVEIIAENTLLPGEIARLHYQRQWHRLVLQVANGSGEADYQVDYEGQGA
ncbi:MAG: hypothetical protein PHF74_01015 [Dehalococcoidales bacterium]|nr:hypothetical protein [Dehalococcoidales bacterium]